MDIYYKLNNARTDEELLKIYYYQVHTTYKEIYISFQSFLLPETKYTQEKYLDKLP